MDVNDKLAARAQAIRQAIDHELDNRTFQPRAWGLVCECRSLIIELEAALAAAREPELEK